MGVHHVGLERVDGTLQRAPGPHVGEIGGVEGGALPRRLRCELVETVRPCVDSGNDVRTRDARGHDADVVAAAAQASRQLVGVDLGPAQHDWRPEARQGEDAHRVNGAAT